MSRAVIRDLGYQPYEGPRSMKSRAWVITWAGLRAALKSRWTKWLGVAALITTGGFGVTIYMAMKVQSITGGMPIPPEVAQKLFKADTFVGSAILFCGSFLGFFIGVLIAGPSLADDLKGGGLHFHFTRPVRLTDYMAGKILPTTLAIALIALIPALVLGFMRLSLSPEGEALSRPLKVLGKGIVLSFTCAVSLSIPAVALSSLTKRRGIARTLWALIYWIPPGIGAALAAVTEEPFYYVLSLSGALEAISVNMFGGNSIAKVKPMVAVVPLAAYVLLGLSLIYWRVRSKEMSSV